MEYAIKEIARVIGAKTNQLLDDTVSLLLTDSRRLSFPEKSLFFALKTKTTDIDIYRNSINFVFATSW